MQRFIRFVIDNHHFSILLVLIIVAYGVVSLYETKLTQDPAIRIPKVMLEFFLDGASPTEIERNVLFPAEAEVRSIEGITDIRTTAYYGYAVSWITFRYGEDAAEKSREIDAALNKVRRRLPASLDFRSKDYIVSDAVVSFLFSVSGTEEGAGTLRETALDLAAVLRKVEDLKGVELVGADEEIHFELDFAKMHRLGIGLDQVAAAIHADNAFAASGRLHINDRDFRFTGPESSYRGLGDMGGTQLFAADGTPVSLAEIAKVRESARGETVLSRLNGAPVYYVVAHAADDINVLEVSERAKAAVEQFRAGLPAGRSIDLLFDQSRGVETIVASLVSNFLQGVAILFGVLLFTVGFRSGLIISTILPLSFLTAMFLLGFTGYGIQQMTIAGFIIALGLLVDNGIVVTENAYLLQKYQGWGAREAAVEGASAAFAPLLSSTLTTMLAFVPIFLLTSDVGLFLRSMSVTIWLSLLASLFVAVTVIALLLSRVGTLGGLGPIPNPPSLLIWLIPFRDTAYRRIAAFVVRWRVLTVIFFLAMLAGSLYIGSRLPLEIFPPTGEPYFTVNLSLAPGLDEERRTKIAEELEAALSKFDDIASVMVFSGAVPPQINLVMDFNGDMVALVKTRTGETDRLRRLMAALKPALNPLKAYGGVSVSLFQYRDFTYTSPFTLKISASDVSRLNDYVGKVDDALRATEGVESMRNPLKGSQTALRLSFRRERAAELGVPKAEVDRWINMVTYGSEIDRFRDGRGEEMPLLVKVARDERAPLEVLDEIMIPTARGGSVPLAELVEPSFEESEARITHVQFEPTVEIDFWNQEGYTPDAVAANVMKTLDGLGIPAGIKARIGGALETQQATFQGLGKNALFTIFLIFAIFVLQFRSFSQPFIVLSAVPLCVMGALGGLAVAGESLTFIAAIGITSLMGIVVNDSILLVEEGNILMAEHPEWSAREVAVEAARKRFMPVLLTSITTVAGLLPMALGESLFKTMAIAICGGLTSSTLLVLFLVPALYSFLSPKRAAQPEGA